MNYMNSGRQGWPQLSSVSHQSKSNSNQTGEGSEDDPAPPFSKPEPAFCLDDFIVSPQVVNAISYRAYRLAHLFGFSSHDIEDIIQSFNLELCRAFNQYDPSRSKAITFASRVLDRAYQYFLRTQINEHRRAHKPVNLSENNPRLWACISEPDLSMYDEEIREGIYDRIRTLPSELQITAMLLRHCSGRDVAKYLEIGKSTLFRRRDRIREHFVNAGFE